MKLNRKIHTIIEHWYEKEEGKALLIKGARQVGKTHIIRSVLSSLTTHWIEFNLINQPEAIAAIRDASSVNELIMGLSSLTDQPFMKGETVIFIDEVQEYKEMVTKIKFLADEGSFRYILSGSLLGVEITNLTSAPVGYLSVYDMYPLDFEEFLQITNISDAIIEHVRQAFEERSPVNASVHQKLLALFRQYLAVGGMPEAVAQFADHYNLNDVLAIHREIVGLYKLDYTKYEAENKRLILTNIYDLVPAELLKQNRRFIISDIKKGLHYERVESSFLWLKNAGVVLPVYNATEPRIPLKINEKQSLFKLYLSDVGMLTSAYGMSTKAQILNQENSINAGGIYENAIAAELVSKGFYVYYYNSKRQGELDFVVEYHGAPLPIEVKSGKDYKVHSALQNCVNHEEYQVREAFVFANCNVERQGKITYLPVYMAGLLTYDDRSNVTVERISF